MTPNQTSKELKEQVKSSQKEVQSLDDIPAPAPCVAHLTKAPHRQAETAASARALCWGSPTTTSSAARTSAAAVSEHCVRPANRRGTSCAPLLECIKATKPSPARRDAAAGLLLRARTRVPSLVVRYAAPQPPLAPRLPSSVVAGCARPVDPLGRHPTARAASGGRQWRNGAVPGAARAPGAQTAAARPATMHAE